MSIDIFSKDEFEQTLEKIFLNSPVLDLGLIDGEYCYIISLQYNIGLYIRSSIGRDKISKKVGEDSIRVFLVEYAQIIALTRPIYETSYLGKSSSRWITRVSGWQNRLENTLLELASYLDTSGAYCQYCNQPLHYFKVKKDGVNKGRIFSTCPIKTHKKVFIWIT